MGDTYSASLPDQFVDITSVADGTYRLVSIVDPAQADKPDGQIAETNNHNNAASVDVRITRQAVSIVAGSAQTGIDAPASSDADRTLQRSALTISLQAGPDALYCEIYAG